MIAKFTRAEGDRVGIRFEPETFEEQLLLEMFARWVTAGYDFQFSGWETNHPGRPLREGLTSVWGQLIKRDALVPIAPQPTPESNKPLAKGECPACHQIGRCLPQCPNAGHVDDDGEEE